MRLNEHAVMKRAIAEGVYDSLHEIFESYDEDVMESNPEAEIRSIVNKIADDVMLSVQEHFNLEG